MAVDYVKVEGEWIPLTEYVDDGEVHYWHWTQEGERTVARWVDGYPVGEFSEDPTPTEDGDGS